MMSLRHGILERGASGSATMVGLRKRRRRQRIVMILVGYGVVFWIGLGCGGNPDADFVDRANEICGDSNTRMAKVEDALSREEGGLDAARQGLFIRETFIPGVKGQLEAIWALEMTAETRAGVARMQLAAEAALQKIRKEPALLFEASGDKSLFADVDQSALALGLNQCRGNPVS